MVVSFFVSEKLPLHWSYEGDEQARRGVADVDEREGDRVVHDDGGQREAQGREGGRRRQEEARAEEEASRHKAEGQKFRDADDDDDDDCLSS